MASSHTTEGAGRLGEVIRLFLKLGIVGFGGPAAHITLMRDEVVRPDWGIEVPVVRPLAVMNAVTW